MNYKLSPSDFAYLWEECKRCYWLKIKMGIARPGTPMPGVFGAINTRVQGNLINKDLREFSPTLPAGIVEGQEGFVESAIYPGTNVYIKGKYDLLVKLSDGTHMIVDLKLSTPTEEKVAKYQSQLFAYKFAFENPKFGERKIISKVGLLIMYPDKVKFEEGRATLDFPPVWMEVPAKHEEFNKLMIEVNKLLSGQEPEAGVNCAFCAYRKKFTNEHKSVTLDLPF